MAPRKVKKEPEVAESSAAASVTTMPHNSAKAEGKHRAARSGAPSIATRVQQKENIPSRAGPPPSDDDDPDGCMLMEVRPARIKVQSQEEDERMPNLPANNMSFMSNPGFQAIGQKLKEVNDTLGTLQSLGIQHVASLPELVLVGDQSAGKSSIMSAIAGLNLPHNTGVCTRCPVHIRLSRSIGSAEWSCRILLQRDYTFQPGDLPVNQKSITKHRPFPPWVKQEHPDPKVEFAVIRERVDSIEHVLRWAQVAILNPDDNYERYIPQGTNGSDADTDSDDAEALARAEAQTQAKFSPNLVALEIRGPDLPDLSFYDLPGVFANARHAEDQYLADVVKNLTREYISHRKAIILWAVPMNTDPETSTTFSIIREMGAANRCLGVMTKADLLPRGDYIQWIRMLQGSNHENGLGYFITSRPDKDGLDQQAAWEEAFFNRQVSDGSAWPIEFEQYDEKCGVVRLKDFLSKKLAEDFAKSLPSVKAIVQKKLYDVVNELQKLPELPPNPEFEIRRGLMDFTNLARTCLQGQAFLDVWKVKERNFKTAISGKKPKCIVKPPTPPAPDVIDLEDETPRSTPNPTPKRRSAANHYTDQNTPSKRRLNAPNGTPSSRFIAVKAENGSPSNRSVNALPVVRTPAGLRTSGMPPSRSLGEIRALIESKSQPGMPNSIPDAVKQDLCKESVLTWEKEVQIFVTETMRLVGAEMARVLDIAFAGLQKRAVYREAKVHLNDFLKEHRENLRSKLMYAFQLEAHQLYTLNEQFFQLNQESELRELVRHRHHYRWMAYTKDESKTRPKAIEEMNADEKKKEAATMEEQVKKMGRDTFEQELEVCAYVRGYYRTAAARFIDNTSLHIVSGLFPTVANQLTSSMYLDTKLGLMELPDRTVFNRLMEEEPKTAELRKQLKEDKKKFDKAMESILALEKTAHTTHEDVVGGMDDFMEVDDNDDDDDEGPIMMSGALNGSLMYGD